VEVPTCRPDGFLGVHRAGPGTRRPLHGRPATKIEIDDVYYPKARHTTHIHICRTPFRACPRPRPHAHASRVLRCGSVSSGNPAVRWLKCNNMHGLVGCCLRITLAGCLTKVYICAQAQQARVAWCPKSEEPVEAQRGPKIRFLGNPGPTARLHRQVLVVQWMTRPDLAEKQASGGSSRTGVRRK
jgi:hypothetical protein